MESHKNGGIDGTSIVQGTGRCQRWPGFVGWLWRRGVVSHQQLQIGLFGHMLAQSMGAGSVVVLEAVGDGIWGVLW